MPFGSKPPFTLQTAQQTVKSLQALWNTRDPKQILTAYAPNFVWRDHFERPTSPKRPSSPGKMPRKRLPRDADELYSYLSGLFMYRREYSMRMELHGFKNTRLAVKVLSEYHGERKDIENDMLGRFRPASPGDEGKLWHKQGGIEHYNHSDDGRIEEAISSSYNSQIKEHDRFFKNVIVDLDDMKLPEVPLHHRLIEDDGPLRSRMCAPYYV